MNIRKFSHLKHAGPQVLLRDGSWRSRDLPITWELLEGDFFDRMSDAPPAHFIFYDPYSYKTNHALWTLEAFKKIHECCRGSDTELFSYTASTRVRAALLAAGFYVSRGMGSGVKTETTVAFTAPAYARQITEAAARPLLTLDWLGKWERSQARFPHALSREHEEDFAMRIRQHQQFIEQNI